MNDLTLTCRHLIKASAQKLYLAWLDPEIMGRYMTMGPEMQCRDAKTDPRVGGRFSFVIVGEQDYPHQGTYRELTPFSRIVFTWETPWSAPGSFVEVTFSPVANGTEVVLTHTKFPSEESRDNHDRGWKSILGRLEQLVA